MTYQSPGGSCKVHRTVSRHWSQSAAAALLAASLLVATPRSRAQSAPAEPAAANPYNAQVNELERSFAAADALHQAALLPRITRLREYVDRPQAVSEFLTQAAASASDPLVRGLAQHYVAEIALGRGDLQQAATILQGLGTIREWNLLGPFASEQPAPRYNANAVFTAINDRQVRWRKSPSLGAREYLNLGPLYPAPAVVYAATSVYAQQAVRVALRFGSDGPVAILVNGRPTASTNESAPYAFDQHSAAAELQAGWNTIVVKLSRAAAGNWRFGLRITAPEGTPVVLTQSRDFRQPGFSVAGQVVCTPPSNCAAGISDLVDSANAIATANPDSADALETLGELEHLFSRTAALEHLQAAARLAPSADTWKAVASACAESSCAFRALNAAVEAHDGAALTALADYYIGRGQWQKARDLLRQALQLAPADFAAGERLAQVDLAAGLKSSALAELESLQRRSPAPLWLREQLATRYEHFGLLDRAEQLAKSALAEDFGNTAIHELLIRIYQRQRNAPALRAAFEQMEQLAPGDPGSRAQLAKLESGMGDAAAAIASLHAAAELAPYNAAIHRQLAEALRASGDAEDSKAELAAAQQLDPSQPSMAQGDDAASSADSAYLVNAAALAAEAHRSAPADNVAVTTLADVRLERVFPNGLSSVRVQQVFYLGGEQGVRDFAHRNVQYEPATQRLELLTARAYKPDGRVVEAEDGGENAVADTSVQMYYDSRSHQLRFPGLSQGDVVELDYRISPRSNVNEYGDYFGDLVVFRTSRPTRLRRFVLITPAARTFNVDAVRMPAAAVTENGAERVYRWDAENLAPLPNEPRGPSVTEVSPYVNVSTFATWQDLGRWYARLIAPQFQLDDALRQQLSKLLEGKNTDQEKIAAIHQFVLRNTHYVALEFGIYSFKPYPVSQTYARRFGDCKDMASLMIALLRAAGIPAEIALVRTRRMGDIDKDATSISVFDHAIVYLPEQDLWLDGTAEYAGSRELPLDDQGAMALTVAEDGNAQMRRIPVSLPMENYTHRKVQAEIAANGEIRFSGSAYTRGEDAPGLRRQFEMPEQQRESLRNNLAQVFPSVQVDAVQVLGANDLERDVTVNFRGELNHFAGQRVLSLAPSWMPRSYVQTLAAQAQRNEELVLPAPWTTEEEIHFALPANATVEELPRTRSINTPFGSALLRYELRGNEIVVSTSVQFKQYRVAAADYAAFRDFCSQIEAAFRDDIRVQLKEERRAD